MSGKKKHEDEGTAGWLSGTCIAPPNQKKNCEGKKNQKKEKTNSKKKNRMAKQNKTTKKATYCIGMSGREG